ncbi:metallophosphoesterase [Alicyclobacillus hesperidum URH17-3-68]|nr:metallophosphoesterase [Alicyclobacillus hesperidum URH17-3-68]
MQDHPKSFAVANCDGNSFDAACVRQGATLWHAEVSTEFFRDCVFSISVENSIGGS